MTQREKLLAAIVGSLALICVAFYAVNRVSEAYALRDNNLLDLESEINKKHTTITVGRRAQRQMEEYLARSLPADRPLAQSLYQNWLLARAKQADFKGVKITPMSARMHGDLYYQHSFLVSARGDFPQLIRFMHEFYCVDYLHRIARLNAKPLSDSKSLDLQITVEALSLNKAEHQRLAQRAAKRLKHSEVEPYVETIAHRNFFAPANKPPVFNDQTAPKGYPNQLVTFRPPASDPEGGQLSYRLAGDPLDGARIDPSSGEFRWTPSALGEFEFDVCVTDNGLPPRSVTKTIKISVVQPPSPPRVGFDPATLAIVTGITEKGGSRLVWVTVRTEGKVLKLQEGDRLEVGSLRGVVQLIRPKEAQFATDDGRVIIVGLGKSLVPDAASPISGL